MGEPKTDAVLDESEEEKTMCDNLAYQEAFPEELINGEVVLMSPAATSHNFISGNIYHIFRSYLKGKKCVPFGDGEAVILSPENKFIPDGMIVCDRSKIKFDGVHGAPDLVVEVLSPSTAKNDRRHKMEVYGASGVREYWIVDPANRSVEQYLRENDRLALHAVYAICPDYMLSLMTEAEKAAVQTEFQCSLFDDLTIHLEDIFENVI